MCSLKGFISLCLSFIIGFHSLYAQTKHVQPNVIFILADDLGYGDLSCYGQKQFQTPNIDRLAKGGMRFTQFYAGTAVCAPSRAAFLLGKHTGHTPIRGNISVKPEGQWPIPDSSFTIAELFKKAGYSTGDFGKWGLGPIGSTGDPIKQGFDQFFGYNCQSDAHNYYTDHLWNNDTRLTLNNSLTTQVSYAPDLIQNKALDFIETNKNKPFFLYMSYTLPHAGLQLPTGDSSFEYFKKRYNESPKTNLKPWDGIGYQPQAYPRAAYAALVTRLDKYVGELVGKLEALGIDKNTLIIFTSDNGPHAEGGNDYAFFNSNAGFKGIKRDLYEGGIREPMIANWPASIKAGTESKQVGAIWDFLPTFAEIIKAPMPKDIDGFSLLPTLTGKGKQKQHAFYYWEFHENGGRQAVLMNQWKGVKLNVFNKPDGEIELYNLLTDPLEKINLASKNPAIVEQIKAIMQTSHIENKDFPFRNTFDK